MIHKITSLDNILVSLLIFVVGMVASQFVVGIKLSTSGNDLTTLERQWARVSQENQKIRENIALHASLTKVSSESLELGLQFPQEIMYLTPVQHQASLTSIEKQ